MTVHALELDLLSVYQERVAVDPLFLEADPPHADVIALLHDERVEIGVFGGPRSRRERGGVAVRCRIKNAGLLLVRVIEKDGRPLYTFNLDLPPFVPAARRGANGEIPDAVLRHGPQGDVAEDAGEPRHVLVFEIAPVTPAKHFHAEKV